MYHIPVNCFYAKNLHKKAMGQTFACSMTFVRSLIVKYLISDDRIIIISGIIGYI